MTEQLHTSDGKFCKTFTMKNTFKSYIIQASNLQLLDRSFGPSNLK